MARIVLPVVGAVVSTYLGAGPAVGWAAGAAIAGVFFPPDLGNVVNDGARMNDLKVSSADYGQVIPIGWGTVGGIGGTIIWAKDIEEVKTSTSQDIGGKGGPSGTVTTVTYQYYGTFAICFGEGPAVEVLRIWANNKILYDGRLVSDSGASAFDRGFTDFTFYPGTEDQDIDPLIAAEEGDLANANLGLCYIVFDRLPLADYGNRIPNITAEIKFSGETNIVTETLYPESAQLSGGNYTINFDTGASYSTAAPVPGIAWSSLNSEPIYSSESIRQQINTLLGENRSYDIGSPIVGKSTGMIYARYSSTINGGIAVINPANMEVVALENVPNQFGILYLTSIVVPSGIPGLDLEYLIFFRTRTSSPGNGTSIIVYQINYLDLAFSGSPYIQKKTEITSVGATFGYPTFSPAGTLGAGGYLAFAVRPLTNDVQSFEMFFVSGWEGTSLGIAGDESTDWKILGVEAQAVGTLTDNPLGPFYTLRRTFYFNIGEVRGLFPNLDWPAGETGVEHIRCAAIDKSNNDLLILQVTVGEIANENNIRNFHFAYSLSQHAWVWGSENFRLGQEIELGSTHWPTAQQDILNANSSGYTYEVTSNEVKRFDMSTGLLDKTWEASIPGSTHYAMYDSQKEVIFHITSGRVEQGIINFGTGEAESVAVQQILDDLATRAGFATSPYLETTAAYSDGYIISGAEATRTSIERLGVTYKFSIIESDFGLKVKSMSEVKPPVTIEEADLVVQDELIKESRISETSMPQAYSLTYLDPAFEYQANTVTSKVYNSGDAVTGSVNTAATNLAIVMSADYAKQLVETILESAWEERWGLEYKIPQKYLAVEPTDLIDLSAANALFSHRISSSDLGTNFNIEINGVNADSSTYLSDSVTDGNFGYKPPSLPSSSLTRPFIIDTPYLRDEDAVYDTLDTLYYAAGAYGIGTWPGALVERSVGGQEYSTIGQLDLSAAWGLISVELPDTDMPFTPDEDSIITLSVISGSMSSTDDDSLLSDYSNAIAIYKSNGDIEVIQARDIVDNGNNTYDCSYLLRGRRGTDYATGNNAPGLIWIALNTSNVEIATQALDLIGSQLYYRMIPLNQTLADAIVTPTVSDGNALKPYAPVNEEVLSDGTDITINWERRTRYNGGLQDGSGEVPLNEDAEAYEVDIYVDENTIVRTLTSSTTTVQYLNADILADFGSIPSSLLISVYQISSKVDRGFSVRKTIEVQNV